MEKLPSNLIYYICCFLPIKSIFYLGLSCKKLSKVLENEVLWKKISERDLGENLLTLELDGTWKDFVKSISLKWEIDSPVSNSLRVKKKTKKQKKKILTAKKKKKKK